MTDDPTGTMLSIDGYRVRECIHESPHSEVYTATRDSDGLRVVLKLYRGASSDGARTRAQREFDVLQRIQHEGVVRAVELRAHADRHVLIVERMPGYPLSRYAKGRKLAVVELLPIALGVVHSLAAVHDARIIHKDLKLANILIDPERLRTCLIDFGISAEFGRAERTAPPQSAEGTMRYMAPEQTGRVGLGVDFRTDLYSFGVILYELLSGRPPFRTKDALELIHAHVAFQPPTLVEIDSGIPLVLSRLVAKLLEKDPELRYQTARGLAADLELCQKQLLESGELDDDLVLGTEDASDRLRFPRRIYGRERESAELQAALARTAQGSMELVLLAGPAGIGKSSLPALLRERLARTGGYLAEAKFDPDLRERPYAGFAAAFTEWVEQILPERKERRAMWAAQIRSSVGAIGQALVGLAPSLAYVVTDFPAVPTLAAKEARERLALAVLRFVRAVARPAHPLVLFLDDLQWADAGSLFLLGALLRSNEPLALLVIGGFRDNEVAMDHPLAQLLRELESGPTPIRRLDLPPLRLEDTSAMLADALGRERADVEWLARRVGPKSQHNPLLVRRLMFHLWDRDLLHYVHGRGWVWDEARLTEAEITDDAAAMVAARIDALPATAREIVKRASLIGTVFEVEMVVELCKADRLDVLQQLMRLVDEGVLAPCRNGFKFVHDRLREAAQSLLSYEERAELHHRTAQLLLEGVSPEALPALSLQLAEHLSGALELLSEEERPRAIEILYLAGRSALEKGAAGSAAHYLGLARSILVEADWESRFELAFNVYMGNAEAAFHTRAFPICLEFLEALRQRNLSTLQRARVTAQRIAVFNLSGEPNAALDLMLQSLQEFGIRWPRSPSRLRARLDVLLTDWLLRGPLDDRTFPRRDLADMDWLAPILIISAGAAPMIQHSNFLLSMAVGYVLRSYRCHAFVRNPGESLAAYAAARALIRRDLKGMQRYVDATVFWASRKNQFHADVRLQYAQGVTLAWLRPRRSVVDAMQRTSDAALEFGELEFAYYALHQSVILSALAGEVLPALMQRIDALQRSEPATRARYPAEGYRRVYRLLQVPAACSLDWDREAAALDAMLHMNSAQIHVRIHWMVALCFMGQMARACEESERILRLILLAGTTASKLVEYVLFRGICHSARAEAATTRLERWRALWTLRGCLRQLRAWGASNPDFVHMVELLQAERARLRGDPTAALRRYQDAAQQARSAGYRHHAALCHERRASLLERSRRGTEAETALASAIALYEEWGALAKVQQLRRRSVEL